MNQAGPDLADRYDPANGRPRGLRSSLAVVFLNRYVVLAVNFGSTMVLARLVLPAETGLFSVAASVMLLAQAIRDFGIAEFLVQEKDLSAAKIRTAFGMTLILAWTLGLLIFSTKKLIADAYDTPELADLLGIVCVSFAVAPISSTVLALLNREMAFGILLRISLVSTCANAVVAIGLAYLGWGAFALTYGMLAMNVTTAAMAAASARSWDHFVPSLREWRTLASFGAYMSGANIISQLTARIPDLIIGRVLGYQALGLYNRANGIVLIFQESIVAGIQTVAFPAFSSAHRNGENLREPYLRTVTLITGAAFPLLGLIAIVAEPLVWCLLGPNWLAATPLIPPLALTYSLILMAPMVSVLLSATGWFRMVPRIALAVQFVQLVVIATGARFSIQWVVFGNIAYGALHFLIASYYLHKGVGVTLTDLLKANSKSIAVAVICLMAPLTIVNLPALADQRWLGMMLASCAWGFSWCVAVVLVKHPIVGELRLLLAEMLPRTRRLAQ